MPLYEYQCDACVTRFERIVKFSDPPIDICPSCGGKVRKLLSSPAIQFKGTGWYITDYAKKSGKDTDKSSSTPASGATSDTGASSSSTSDKGSSSDSSKSSGSDSSGSSSSDASRSSTSDSSKSSRGSSKSGSGS